MRLVIHSATYSTLALALIAALAAPAAEAQSISVPPFVTRGFPPYADGTPCIGTPRNPQMWPDKVYNPCDGIPLQPEQIPGPFPPAPPAVNVTAPGGQTVPPSKAEEPEHRVKPAETAAEPNGKHEPIRSVPGATSFTPSGKPRPSGTPTIKQNPDGSLYIEYIDKPQKRLGFGLFIGLFSKPKASDRLGEFEYKTEPGDAALGELKRTRTIYKPTGQVVLISTEYQDGRIVDEQFRIGGSGAREFYTVYKPHPAKKGYYKAVESIYNVNGRLKEVRFYNPDGTLDRVMVPEQPAAAPPTLKHGTPDIGKGKPDITHGTPDIGKTPVVPDPGQPLPKPTPDPDVMPKPKPAPDDKPIPYLPPFTALRPAGEVTDVTPQNQSAINAQLRNSKRPVFRLTYSSADPRSKSMSDWLDRAAKANPAVVFLRQDATKIFVTSRAPSVSLDIPRPTRAFSETGYRTDAELDKFLREGLATWTPITHQRP